MIARRALRPEALEQYSQVAVRPDGTVDVVWNDLRSDAVVILHAASKDGGARFGRPERVTTIPSESNPVGLVSSLAVSRSGTLAVCRSGSIRPKRFLPRIACSLSSGGGAWSKPTAPFSNVGSQYLPAATFQRERPWVAAYQSTARTTRVLLTRSDDGRTFAKPLVLAQRGFGRARKCAPHPPDCGAHQRFVGDYTGAVAGVRDVCVDFVLPARRHVAQPCLCRHPRHWLSVSPTPALLSQADERATIRRYGRGPSKRGGSEAICDDRHPWDGRTTTLRGRHIASPPERRMTVLLEFGQRPPTRDHGTGCLSGRPCGRRCRSRCDQLWSSMPVVGRAPSANGWPTRAPRS